MVMNDSLNTHPISPFSAGEFKHSYGKFLKIEE